MSLYDRDYMREAPPRSLSRTLRDLTAFQIILGINAAVFVMQFVFELGWLRHPLTGELIMPLGGVSVQTLAHGQLWTLFTYMFVHGSVGHFALNMMLLWFAGHGVQQLLGSRHCALIYLGSGIVGAAAEMVVNGYAQGDTSTPLIGASASAFGLLMALAVVRPEDEITAFIYFIVPVRLRLRTLTKTLFLLQLCFGLMFACFDVLPEGLHIAYFAHLGGAALGWWYARRLGYGGRSLSRERRVADGNHEPPASRRLMDSVESLMEEQINPILDKIHLHGIDQLTADERQLLEQASREVRRHRQGLNR